MRLPFYGTRLSHNLVVIGFLLGFLCLSPAGQANEASDSHEAERLNHRGQEYLHKKEYDKAIELFREALRLQPDLTVALDNLGNALELEGKDEAAIAEFDKALKIAPENAALYHDKGLALFHEKKYEEALAAFRKAVEIHSDFAEAQNGLGATLLSMGKPDEAAAALRKAVESAPKNADALNKEADDVLAYQVKL